MNARLLKILGLLESDNDAEALQALRTAQKLLLQSRSSLQKVFEEHAKIGALASGSGYEKDATPKSGFGANSDSRSKSRSHRAYHQEISVLQTELRRYRHALEEAYQERAVLQEELRKIQSFLKTNQTLKVFQRLREREENVRSLTKEIRRLKDENFLLDRKLKEFERKQVQNEQAAPSPSDFEHLLKTWVKLAQFEASDHEADWISVKMLFQIFVQGKVSLLSGESFVLALSIEERAKLGIQRFAALFSKLVNVQAVTLGGRGSRKGFQIKSVLELGAYEVSQPPTLPQNRRATDSRKQTG